MSERRDSRGDSTSGADASCLIGAISDTHGLLRPGVFAAFRGVSHILHAGDLEDPGTLDELAALAPVIAVWGNMDGGAVRALTAESRQVELSGVPIAIIHGHQLSDYGCLPDRFPEARVIVHGHTHLPSKRMVRGVLVLNPGSAGAVRPGKPVTVALLRLHPDGIRAWHVHV